MRARAHTHTVYVDMIRQNGSSECGLCLPLKLKLTVARKAVCRLRGLTRSDICNSYIARPLFDSRR